MPCSTCFTNGQCTQRNITSNPPAPFAPSRVTVLPETTSGSEKSGAIVPRGCIVDSVRAMHAVYGSGTLATAHSEKPAEGEEELAPPRIANGTAQGDGSQRRRAQQTQHAILPQEGRPLRRPHLAGLISAGEVKPIAQLGGQRRNAPIIGSTRQHIVGTAILIDR